MIVRKDIRLSSDRKTLPRPQHPLLYKPPPLLSPSAGTAMSTLPRILVLSASVGAGHLRAAQAVELALREIAPEATVRNVDVLEWTNAAFRQLYGKAYLDLVNKAPHVLGYFYDLLDQPRRSGRKRGHGSRLPVEKMNLRSFIRFLKRSRGTWSSTRIFCRRRSSPRCGRRVS